ncbi:MAG: tetratricopeptide repeat protein, partial [Myxococcota bacterium]
MRSVDPHRFFASFLVLSFTGVSGSVWAQDAAEPAPASPPSVQPAPAPTRTSTAANAIADENRPTSGPGSLISEVESEPPAPMTAAEIDSARDIDAQLQNLARELEYFSAGAESFDVDMRDLIRIKYDEQRDRLASQYDRAVDELEKGERQRRLEAIARFEAFLKEYPDDATYTPDAMFRLAELHYEKSSDIYLQLSRGYEDELQAYESGERQTEPPVPQPSFEETIGLHKELLTRFPDYRLSDAARYLLGYCYGEQGQMEEALAAYLDLVDNNRDSKFLAEVWTRIGEIYFDGSSAESLEKAIAAYNQVRNYPDSPYYDKALYKVAWTYYRLDRFDESVGAFVELIDYADEQKRTTGVTGSELRAEAIQYVAISLADEGWGGLERAQTVLGALRRKDYTGEIWKRYGEVLFDQTRYRQAIDVLATTIQKYPDASYNPEAQERIVRAHEQLRDFDGATEAREKLVADYSKGSNWYTSNNEDREAITKAESLTERSLYTAAIFRHQQAQAYKGSGKLPEAVASYQQAATAYQSYLDRVPSSNNAYDFEFYLAECLFYSGDYPRAAEQYDKVRDSRVDNKHLAAAALSSVITYEKNLEALVSTGKLPKLDLLKAAERKEKRVAPKPLDQAHAEFVASSDRFITLLPKSERAPAIRYRAAEVFYKHDQFDEARRRFLEIVDKHPDDQVAQYASNLLIESYLATEDWANVEKWSAKLLDIAKRDPSKEAVAASTGDERAKFLAGLRGFKVGAQFKQAEKYDAAGDFERAAETYIKLVDENDEHEFADKALFNAAVAFEKVRRYDSASKTYRRIFDKYPKSDLAPRALFRVGINAEKGFDFPEAVAAYKRLTSRYPKSENRADAMYNMAVVLENQQVYGDAAKTFQGYAQAFPSREDAPEIYFRSALVYEKMKDFRRMVSTLSKFIQRYGKKTDQRERVVEAYLKIGDAYKAQKRVKGAQRNYTACQRRFQNQNLAVRGRAGAAAAKCAFELAEARFSRYSELKIQGTGRRQIRALRN